MRRLIEVQELVNRVLRDEPQTRDDDFLLFLKVCAMCSEGIDEMSFGAVVQNRKDLNIPVFESVRRTRQKLQARYPELRGSKYIRFIRKEAEEEYRQYAVE